MACSTNFKNRLANRIIARRSHSRNLGHNRNATDQLAKSATITVDGPHCAAIVGVRGRQGNGEQRYRCKGGVGYSSGNKFRMSGNIGANGMERRDTFS